MLNWKDKQNGVDDILAEDINNIANSLIETQKEKVAEITNEDMNSTAKFPSVRALTIYISEWARSFYYQFILKNLYLKTEVDEALETKENTSNKVAEITDENEVSTEQFPSNSAVAAFVREKTSKTPRVDDAFSSISGDFVTGVEFGEKGFVLVPISYGNILEKREPVVIKKNLDGIESSVGSIIVDVDSGMRDWINIYLEVPATTKGTVSVLLDGTLAAAQPNGTNTSKTYVNFSLRWNGRRWESYSIVGSGATSGGNIYGRPSYNASARVPKSITIDAPDVFPVGTKYVICCGQY